MLKPTIPLTDRLIQLANEARTRADALPLGTKRDALMRAAALSETAVQIQAWLGSPGLRPPK